MVEIESLPQQYNGIYTDLDTGPAVQGREVDVYMWSCHEALEFGRRPVRLTVLRLGWNPKATDAELPRPDLPAPRPNRRSPRAAAASAPVD